MQNYFKQTHSLEQKKKINKKKCLWKKKQPNHWTQLFLVGPMEIDVQW